MDWTTAADRIEVDRNTDWLSEVPVVRVESRTPDSGREEQREERSYADLEAALIRLGFTL